MAFFKKHGLIFFFALVVGLFVVSPTIVAIVKIGPDFKGIYPMFNNDEDQYLAMTREAYDGHYHFGSVYLKEHKDDPYLRQPLAEIVLATTAKLLHISVPKLFAINDFALPFIGVVVLYFLFFGVTGSITLARWFAVGYYTLLLYWFNRPINPQLSFIFLFLGLWVIWEIFKREEENFRDYSKWNIFLAFIFGAAFYIYPFVWSSLLVVYALVLALLMVKNKRIVLYGKYFLCFAVPVALCAIPYLVELQLALRNPNYMAENLRFGFIFNHWPGAYFNVLLMVFSVAVLYLATCKRDLDKRTLFGYCLALAGIILNWQNVITGKAFSFSMHYYWVVVLFSLLIFSIVVISLGCNFGKEKFYYRRLIAVFLMIIVLGGLLYKESGSIKFGITGLIDPLNMEDFREQQKLSAVADWFNNNTPHNSAVYSLTKKNHWFITSYTYNNDFQNANAGLFLISDDELENRWVIQNFFRKNIDGEYIKKHHVDIWTNKFIEEYQSKTNRNKIMSFLTGAKQRDVELVPHEYIDRVLAKIAFYNQLGFEKALKQYEVDYVLLDKNDKEYSRFIDLPLSHFHSFGVPIAVENYLIYKLVK